MVFNGDGEKMKTTIRRRILTTIIALLLLTTAAFAAQTVYITNTGSKYHASGCRYLSKSQIPIPISLSDAKAQGYGACSVCKPPR